MRFIGKPQSSINWRILDLFFNVSPLMLVIINLKRFTFIIICKTL